jgi:hypothetical protein
MFAALLAGTYAAISPDKTKTTVAATTIPVLTLGSLIK